MTFILISTVIYLLLTFIASQFLLSLPVPMLLFILYLLPLIINFVMIKLQKNRIYRTIAIFLNPTLSLLFYTCFSYLTMTTGTWLKFVKANTISDNSMSVEISKDLLSVSQIIFIIILYYGISLIIGFILRKSSIASKGVKYA